LSNSEKKIKDHTASQQQEHQEILQRHLKFIDRLMADKKELSDKCETLSSELLDRDKKLDEKVKEIEDRHAKYASFLRANF
jgi:5-azacytidine-induced protein 1